MTFQGNFCSQKPDIIYPCNWEYKIILDKNIQAKDYIKGILQDDFSIKVSKNTPKYTSYNLTINVADENHRLKIFTLLKQNCKYVL